jgi:hypothetical protein
MEYDESFLSIRWLDLDLFDLELERIAVLAGLSRTLSPFSFFPASSLMLVRDLDLAVSNFASSSQPLINHHRIFSPLREMRGWISYFVVDR